MTVRSSPCLVDSFPRMKSGERASLRRGWGGEVGRTLLTSPRLLPPCPGSGPALVAGVTPLPLPDRVVTPAQYIVNILLDHWRIYIPIQFVVTISQNLQRVIDKLLFYKLINDLLYQHNRKYHLSFDPFAFIK